MHKRREWASVHKGYSIALASAAILSTTAVLIRYLTESYGIPPLVLAFWRDVFTALAILPVLLLSRRLSVRLDRRHLRYMVFYGLVLALFNTFWTNFILLVIFEINGIDKSSFSKNLVETSLCSVNSLIFIKIHLFCLKSSFDKINLIPEALS